MTAEPSDRDLYLLRFVTDDGWRPEEIRYATQRWTYDPEDDVYRCASRTHAFGRPILPRTLDWFSMRPDGTVETRGEARRRWVDR